MSDAERLAGFVTTWEQACADFVAVARAVPREQWDAPTDLDGWSVKDNVAHTAHLEAVLAGSPEESVEVAEAPHIKGLMNVYTEQGVLARRDQDMEALCAEIEDAVARRLATLRANPPADPKATDHKTPGDVGWDLGTLLSNRPFDVWMHEQDIRRAIDRPGGYDSPAAAHVMQVFARAFPMIVGKKAAARPGETVVLEVPEAGVRVAATVGDDARAVASDGASPTVTIRMGAEAYVVASGGRRSPEGVTYEGDDELGMRVVDGLSVTP